MEAGGVVVQSEGEKILLAQGKKPPYETLTKAEKRVIYLSIASGMFLAAMDMNVVIVALPSIIKDLGQPELFTWVMASYMLTSSAVMVLYGRFSDIYGRRVVYLFAVAVFAVGSVLCGAATSLWFLIVARGVAGIGGGGLQSLGLTIVGDITEPAKRPGIIAGLSSIGALSSLLGPLVGGGITDSGPSGWRWIFYINMPFCLLAFVSSWIAMRRFELPVSKMPVDILGSFFIASACICIVLFVLWGGAETGYPWDSGVIIGLMVASVVLLVLFIWQEMRHPLPIIELSMFKIRNVAVIMPLIFFIGVQMFAGFTFLPVYFQSIIQDSALMSGVKLFPLVGMFLFGAGAASAIMQKTGKIGYLIPAGAVMLTVGLGLMGTLQPDTNFGVVAGFMLIFGVGIGMIFALVSVTLQNSVSAEQMGVVMSAFAFFQLLGGSIGVAIVGALLNHWTESFMMEYPMNPLLAVNKALDNVFISTVVPGAAVCILSVFIQNVKLEPHPKHVEEMDTLEKGTSKPNEPTKEIGTEEPPVRKESQVEQALAEVRGVIERKKSMLLAQQEVQEARQQQERESQRQEKQQQESRQEVEQSNQPKDSPRQETLEEMETRLREAQLLMERERELEDQRQREAEILERAERAMAEEAL